MIFCILSQKAKYDLRGKEKCKNAINIIGNLISCGICKLVGSEEIIV